MVVERFETLLKKERIKDIIPFLKELRDEDRKVLAPALKTLHKEYSEAQQVSIKGGFTFKQKGTEDQFVILMVASFCVSNRKDFEKIVTPWRLFNYKPLLELLEWYCPPWFDAFINGMLTSNWMPWQFNYEMAMIMAKKGYITPSDELLVRLLPESIFVRDGQNSSYQPQLLERWPETLQQHVWFLFQFESSIPYSDNFAPYKQEINWPEHRWMQPLKQYSEKGVLDRTKLLKESILASSRNFNKTLTAWFVDFFVFMEPTSAEIIALQPDLFIALNSTHSKAVNTILNSLKTIGAESNFQAEHFFENVPLLLASETKVTVSSTLQLLEKIIKGRPELKETASMLACQAFIHTDEAIQTKAAKLILKHGDDHLSVTEELNKYQGSLLMSARKTLQHLITEAPSPAHQHSESVEPGVSYEPLAEVSTLDELIFLASQAFDNNDPMHIDLLPAAMVKLQDQLTGSTLTKFEPALQRAYKIVMGDWPSTMGYLDHLLATFFIDLTKLWIERNPEEGASLKLIHQSFRAQDDENKTKWKWYERRILELPSWRMHTRDTTYEIHKSVLHSAYLKILRYDKAPLLSTPTHAFGYVDPVVLVARLEIYQRLNSMPHNYDFQLAISRVAPFHREQALDKARRLLSGEILSILDFLLVADTKPQPPFTTPSLWYMAAVTKNPSRKYEEFSSLPYARLSEQFTTGVVPWKSFTETFYIDQYNYQKRKSEKVEKHQNVLRLTIQKSRVPEQAGKTPETWLSKVGNWLTSFGRKEAIAPQEDKKYVPCLYELLTLKGKFISAESNDLPRFLYLFPSNPNPLITLITSSGLAHSTPSSESYKKLLSKTLEALMPLRFTFNEITHLFTASCMLCSDKTVRSFAAELWISAVRHETGNSERMGEIVGIHVSAEYAPLKRFTDLVSSNLLNISSLHNQQLEMLLTKVLEQLPDDAPVGSKKLLEQFSELVSINQSAVRSEKLLAKLKVWQTSASMKKTIESLM